MGAYFTKEKRQEIVREFATRHNGVYNPALFLEEVQQIGPSHPAYTWFQWDQEKAARAYQVEQAREFARGLKIVYTVEEIVSPGNIRVVARELPLVISPLDSRCNGGGYVLTDPTDAAHMAEFCRQGALALTQWLEKYSPALEQVGATRGGIEMVIGKLKNAQSTLRAD